MILNLSINEEIEQDAREIEGRRVPETLGAEMASESSTDVVEEPDSESKVASSRVIAV